MSKWLPPAGGGYKAKSAAPKSSTKASAQTGRTQPTGAIKRQAPKSTGGTARAR